MVKTKIAVLVSGGGTNLQALLDAQREGVDLLHLALGKVGIDDICQKVFISHIGSPCQGTQRAPYTHNTI